MNIPTIILFGVVFGGFAKFPFPDEDIYFYFLVFFVFFEWLKQSSLNALVDEKLVLSQFVDFLLVLTFTLTFSFGYSATVEAFEKLGVTIFFLPELLAFTLQISTLFSSTK